jgi:3-dehydrosphinganine reductase
MRRPVRDFLPVENPGARAALVSHFMDLRAQHVLITGGSSGIGLALARQAAAAGARVSLVARDAAKLAAARSRRRRRDVYRRGRCRRRSATPRRPAAAERAHGPVDVLIASAGVARPGYFEEVPVAVFERTMAVNYFGTLYALKAVVPAMRARGRGAVVLVSSGAGLHGFFGYTPYSPSKFALRGLAEALRAEMKDTGVHVMIVYPPDTDTPQLAEENRTKPVETQAITAGGGLWTAEAVARLTLAGWRAAVSPSRRAGRSRRSRGSTAFWRPSCIGVSTAPRGRRGPTRAAARRAHEPRRCVGRRRSCRWWCSRCWPRAARGAPPEHARVTREGGTVFLGERLMQRAYTWIDALAAACVRLGLRADTVTWFSLVAGLVAGLLAARGWLGCAAWALALSGLCDGLDGAIARRTHTASAAAPCSIPRWTATWNFSSAPACSCTSPATPRGNCSWWWPSSAASW